MVPAASFQISQYNATLTLAAQPVAMGQYVSGDFWVVGPITIVGTEPAAAGGRNGFEARTAVMRARVMCLVARFGVLPLSAPQVLVARYGVLPLSAPQVLQVSPKSIFKQPYDSRAAGYDSALLPQLPLTVNPGDNVVKMVSLASWPGGNPTYISTAMIVTVVASPPASGSYRPAYFRNNSAAAARQWTVAQLRWDAYPSLPLPPAPNCPPAPEALCTPPPPLDAVVTQRYSMPQIDHLNDWVGGQIHPAVNMPDCHYGEAIPQAAGLAAARLLLNDSAAAKAAAAHGLVQYGIDLGGIVAGGGFWFANGGWANGRKLVLGLSALVLGQTNLSSLTAGVPVDPHRTFSEDTEVVVAPHATAPGAVLWGNLPSGEDAYWKLVVSGDGERIQADPYGFIDGGAVPGSYYDFCCVYKPWKGEALPQLLSPLLTSIMDAGPLLTFVQRRYTFGTWTLPDPCAPPTGACSDGSGRCAGWLNSPCGAGGAGKCVLDLQDYGVLFGPNNSTPGHCIAGKGRFPDLHGKNADAGDGQVGFVERLFASLVNYTSA